jgi:hypothetical protein
MNPEMDATTRLLETESLRALKARYFYFLDTKDWPAWLALFTPDATLSWDRGPASSQAPSDPVVLSGIDAIAANVVERGFRDAATVHHGHTPILELLSPTEARGIWAMEDRVARAGRLTHSFGHYHDSYRKTADGWRIAASQVRRSQITETHF